MLLGLFNTLKMTVFGVKVSTVGIKRITLFGSKKWPLSESNKEMTWHRIVDDYVKGSQLENYPKVLVKDDYYSFKVILMLQKMTPIMVILTP